VNGELVSEYYSIKEGDDLRILGYYTLEKLLEFMDLPFTEHIYVNNRLAGKDEKIYENFTVEWMLEGKENETVSEQESKESDKEVSQITATVAKAENTAITIVVNRTPVILKGKSSYVFVDILDVYPFDVSAAHGEKVVMLVNGEEAEFTSPIHDGDTIDLYWK
jgi:hypothetical protein